MEIIGQIGIVFGVCLAGELISAWLPVAVPASVIGMVLMLALLCTGLLKPRHIEKKSDFLMKNMAFFFVPAGVGVLEHYGAVQGNVLRLLLVCLITTVLTFGVTARTVLGVIRLQEKRREKKR